MEILTNKSMLDWDDMDVMPLVEEQEQILHNMGFDTNELLYLMRFNSEKYIASTIDDAIQSLALKEGADLVRFSSGNIGYQGYYGEYPLKYNRFEIICSMDEFVSLACK